MYRPGEGMALCTGICLSPRGSLPQRPQISILLVVTRWFPVFIVPSGGGLPKKMLQVRLHDAVLQARQSQLIFDYSNSFGTIRRHLRNNQGVQLVDYVRQLEPNYWRLYRDIGVGYGALGAVLALVGLGQSADIWTPCLVMSGAVLIGFWIFYLQTFLHEGVHWNLGSDRTNNDRIANILLAWTIGVTVETYRRRHFEHHRSLGSVDDPENLYFSSLTTAELLKCLSGARAIAALFSYMTFSASHGKKRTSDGRSVGAEALIGLGLGLAGHGLIVGGLLLLGSSAAALAWILGVGAVMPTLNTVRQLCEHRASNISPSIDHAMMDEGGCARIFGTGWFDRTFGCAGTNRHLLHHWEPHVSYTRLDDLERFLDETPIRAVMQNRRTTYWKTLRVLLAGSAGLVASDQGHIRSSP